MSIVSLSVSHRSVDVLERLVVTPASMDDLLVRLQALPDVDEVLVLSTCNRVEVYAATHGPIPRVTAQAVARLMAAHGQVEVGELRQAARVRIGGGAVEHLFAVACGLNSMAVGEHQIVSQIKRAARTAAAVGTTGPAITNLIDAALRTSKRARTETSIATEGTSLVRAGLDLADAQLGGLAGRHAVVLGTGSTGRLAARLLREAGVRRLSLAGRSALRTAEVAGALGATALRPEDMPATLAETDILVTAIGAAAPVLRAAPLRAARAQGDARPLFVLDLGMPPDLSPATGHLPGVTLVDLKALGRHLADRAAPDPVPRVRAIVAEEALAYRARQKQTAAAPVIAALHEHIRQLAAAELDRLHDRLPDLSDRQRAETAVAVQRILRKVLHQPTTRVKEFAAGPEGPDYLAALGKLFALDVA